MRRLRVAAGVLRDPSGRVLITERVGGGPFQGMWEFPGGKIGDGESPEQALARELSEELGVEPVGRIETRRFQRAGTVLRIFQEGSQSFMEFVRVE